MSRDITCLTDASVDCQNLSQGSNLPLKTTDRQNISPLQTSWIPSTKPQIYGGRLKAQSLANFGQELGLTSEEKALEALARAIASSPMWSEMPASSLIIRSSPRPALGILGRFGVERGEQLATLVPALDDFCASLKYVSYAQAEKDTQQLAEKLIERCGRKELRRFHFTAIPRGGLLVLGMLAYALGLEPEQLMSPHPHDAPLVVVDDCALTGCRFNQFLRSCQRQPIVFAHLYSHPDLRSAIEAQESQVIACVGAQDLQDYAPQRFGNEYFLWRESTLAQLEGTRYWVGQTYVCFAWNEPNFGLCAPGSKLTKIGLSFIPPELCWKNQPQKGTQPIPIQVQPPGKGSIRPSENLLFGSFEAHVVISNIETGERFDLIGVAADSWRAIVEYGDLEAAATALLQNYDVDCTTLRSDLAAFVEQLCDQNLLVRPNGDRQLDCQQTADTDKQQQTYRLFGLTLASDFPLVTPMVTSSDVPTLSFTCDQIALLPGDGVQAQPAYASQACTEKGESRQYLYRLGEYDLLRFTDVADFYLWPDRIVCQQLAPSCDHLVEICLLGQVMAFWLERQGILALHASAAVVDGQAVAFLANKGGGKTSLAATLTQAGYPLLTDDILPLEQSDDGFWGRPGYPQMRMWPDEAEHFLGHYEDLSQVHPAYAKRRIPVGVDGLGTFSDIAHPLACIYLPQRREPAAANRAIEIAKVSPGDAAIELLRHSFIARLVTGLGNEAQRLKFFTQLVAQVPIRKVIYPSGFEHLPRIREAILQDLKILQA